MLACGMRRAARIDTNHHEIVDALRARGAAVYSLAAVGEGLPDLLVGYRGHTFLFEIKHGRNPLTPDQTIFFHAWVGGPLQIVRSVADGLRAIDCSVARSTCHGGFDD